MKPKSFTRGLRNTLSASFKRRPPELDPAAGYALWAATYDDQPANLMLQLEGEDFSRLLARVGMKGKVVIDVGCGTGRNWPKILACQPAKLTGFDVSPEMLNQLSKEYPNAEARLIPSGPCVLPGLAAASTDVIVCNLALAHVENPVAMFAEWDRVLRPSGDIIVTDYHPAALAKGADRTFRHEGRLVAIRNYVHPLANLKKWTTDLGWSEVEFIESKIEPRFKHFYEDRNALDVYQKFLHTPILFGWLLKKA